MPVVRIDVSNGARPASHHQAVAACAVCVVTNAAQKLAVGDAGGGKEDVVAANKIVHREYLAEVVTQSDSSVFLFVVAGQ